MKSVYKKLVSVSITISILFLNSTAFISAENNFNIKNYSNVYSSKVDNIIKQQEEKTILVPVLKDDIQTTSAKILLKIIKEIESSDQVSEQLKEKTNDYIANLISITNFPEEYLGEILDTLIRLQTVPFMEESEQQMLLLSITTSLLSNVNHSEEINNKILSFVISTSENSDQNVEYKNKILLASALKYSVPTEDMSEKLLDPINALSSSLAYQHDTYEPEWMKYCTNMNSAECYFNMRYNTETLGFNANLVKREPGKGMYASNYLDSENGYAHMSLSILVGTYVNQKIQFGDTEPILELVREYLKLDEGDDYAKYPMVAEYVLVALQELSYILEEYLEYDSISFEEKSDIYNSMKKTNELIEKIFVEMKDTASEQCGIMDDIQGYGCFVLEWVAIGKVFSWLGIGARTAFAFVTPKSWIPMLRVFNIKRISFFRALRGGVAKYSGFNYVKGVIAPNLINNAMRKLEYEKVLKYLARKSAIQAKTPNPLGERLAKLFVLKANGSFQMSVKKIMEKSIVDKRRYINAYFTNSCATMKIGRFNIPVKNKEKLREFLNILDNLKLKMNSSEVLGFATITRGFGLNLKDSFVQNIPSTIVAFAMAQFLAKWGNPIMHYSAHKGNYGLETSLEYAKNYSIIQANKNTNLLKILVDFTEIQAISNEKGIDDNRIEEILREVNVTYETMERMEELND